MEFHIKGLGDNCLGVTGGFSGEAGSFAGLAVSARDQVGLGETIEADVQYGVRLRRVQLGFTEPIFQAKRLEAGFTVYGQRFQYDQARDASILAFSRDISEFDSFGADNLLKYVSHNYGGTAFLQFALRKFSRLRLTYSYDVTGVSPLTGSTSDYFGGLDFENARGTNQLSGIRSGKVLLSYSHNTVDRPLEPTHGAKILASLAIAGAGGDVSTIEPAIDFKWFHPGLRSRHVIGIHLHGSMLTGYGGKAAPPWDRYYMGGQDEIRGFASWTVSPIGYVPAAGTVPVLNADGSQRLGLTYVNGVPTLTPVTMTIPVYRPVSIGGDTKVVANAEYRIPLVRPLRLALFADAGVDRSSFASQLRMNDAVVNTLNTWFPAAEFTDRVPVQPDSQKIRMSTGVELQVLVPKIHTPVRLYWAYNLLRYEGPCAACTSVKQPFDRSMFPNAATYESASALFGTGTLVREPRSMLRIAIGFSF